MTELIVTMDGPAGTGKSTVSRAVASILALPHLDTGAFYRAAGLIAVDHEVDLDDGPAVAAAVATHDLDQDAGRMLVDGRDVSERIRTAEMSRASSMVSAHPEVRSLLVQRQREWVDRHGDRAVVEGRDIGSVVFPHATVKVYLDATPEIRARRRAGETGESLEDVLAQVIERDRRDSTRIASPMIVPDGATVIDTSDLDVAEVVSRVIGLVERVSA